MWKLKLREAKLVTKPQVSGKANLTQESELLFTIRCSLPGTGIRFKLGVPTPLGALLCWDGWAWPVREGEWDVGWVVGAFFHDHCGDTSLGISFNADTSLEAQVDKLTQQRPAGNKIHSEQRSRSPFTLPTWVHPSVWTLYGMSMDNVNMVYFLYGIYFFTLGVYSPGHMDLVHVIFLYSITLIIKIKIIVNIYWAQILC